MKRIRVKDCPVCDKIIWKYKFFSPISISAGSLILTYRIYRPYEMKDIGRHFWILESTGKQMMVAICKDCLDALSDKTVKQIFADITRNKLMGAEKLPSGDRKYQVYNYIRVIEPIAWSRNRADLVDFVKNQQG